MDYGKFSSVISSIEDFLLGFIKWCREFYAFATYYVEDPFPAEEDPNLTF